MPVVIVADPGAPNANSYATEAEANAYHETVIDSAAWDDADSDMKRRALVSATRALDTQVQWIGRALSGVQSLGWPRYNAVTRNGYIISAVIPAEVKNATAELARRLIASGGAPTSTGENPLKGLKAGPVNLTFRDDVDTSTAVGFPADVFQMIAHLARTGLSSGVRSVPVVRV